MKLTIDTASQTLTRADGNDTAELPLYSREAWELLSREWIRVGWNQKYQYTFSWFGRPVIQLPEDLVRIQEVIYSVKPDLIVETGVAHGGSLIFYSSLCQAMGKGRVIGIDIEIRPHNREALEAHPMRRHIHLIERSSTDPETIDEVLRLAQNRPRVMVMLMNKDTVLIMPTTGIKEVKDQVCHPGHDRNNTSVILYDSPLLFLFY